MNNLVRELQRRNVFRVAAAYLVVGWIVMQVVDVIGSAAGIPPWANAFALIVLIVAFPVIIFIAWAFELTPDGMKRTADVPMEESRTGQTGSVLNIAIIAGLAIVVVLLVWQQFSPTPEPELAMVEPGEASTQQDGPVDASEPVTAANTAPERSVAVLPFVSFSSDEDDRYFADGLTEEILNSLAAVPDLIVTSRTSAFQFRGDNLPSIPEIAGRLGVAHILEGSIRPSRDGAQVRITAQLIRADDDAHLWSQTYDRSMEDVFAIQEDIAENIAGVLGVALDDDARARMARAGTSNIEAFVAYQRGYEMFFDIHDTGDTATELQPAFDLFMQAVELDPTFADAYYLAADMYAHQLLRFNDLDAAPDMDAFAAVRQQYADMLRQAQDNTEHPGLQALISLDMQYMSDDWSGMSRFFDRLDESDGCRMGSWLPELAVVSGRGERIAAYQETRIQCDPLNLSVWESALTINRGAGDYVRAREIAEHIFENFGERAGNDLAMLRMRLDEMDELNALLESFGVREQFGPFFEAHFRASRGDAEMLTEVFAAFESAEDFDPNNPIDFTNMVALGRRDQANEIAARFDALPLGHHPLIGLLYTCMCGAPWDLEATPNFAERLEEANFPWPPAGAGRYPANEVHNQPEAD